ncbi:RusA family crossover junction endodeoxyribonuclease [Tsukamurella asaccharolytica]|uniref:RusA family crossover junction endodeoxyribonuclease n=1 Tax=Tsukamurella asaccharolytica TaxID=2592067 RepID=A0A5C5RCY8_9ACTN|nr:RusA family crossover junction endodeoxyribonuclease [Tsukamurella asaccharolytica]TWS20790.1 RusA family crossover junction endodeoxyribonuclease [Tsukamurella asaccharolytica]
MTTYTVFVPGRPAPQGSKRHVGRGIMVESSKAVGPWRAVVALTLGENVPAPIDGPVTIRAEFVMPRPKALPKTKPTPAATKKPDVDKLLRAILDAGTSIAWIDDSQIVDVHATKRIAERDEQPGVALTITHTDPEATP